MDDPRGQEFRRAILETRLGRDVEDALEGIAARVKNEDFAWVVDAMRINRTVGGDLAQTLDQVGETITARNRLKRQVPPPTADARLSAMALGLLPLGPGRVPHTSKPAHSQRLLTPNSARTILKAA